MQSPTYDRANKSWKIKVKVDGIWKARTLCKGEFAATPPDHVLELAARILEPAKPVPVVTDEKCGTSIVSYSELYRKRFIGQPGSKRRLASTLTLFQRFAAENDLKLLSEVGVKHINLFVDHRRDQGTQDSTICSDLAQLQGMFRKALIEEEVTLNPVRVPASEIREAIVHTKKNRTDDELEEEIKYYTRKQQSEILNALDLFALPKFADVVRIMLATGMRIDAVLKMEFRHINEKGYVRVPARNDKAGKGYTTYLFTPESKAIVARRREHFKDGRVFPDLSSTTQVYHYLERFYANKKHKINPQIFDMGTFNHAWRHTFATNMIEDGLRVEVLKDFMGHADVRVTQRYAKVSDDAKDAAVLFIENKINNRITLD